MENSLATILGLQEADLEDVFHADLYARILNEAFGLTGANQATGQMLIDADPNTTRLVKKAEAFFRVLPPDSPEFDHYTPMEWLFRHPELLDGDAQEVVETIARAERVITAVNQLPEK